MDQFIPHINYFLDDIEPLIKLQPIRRGSQFSNI